MHWSLNKENKVVVRRMLDIFLVSVIYWLSLLVIFLWLNRRLVLLTKRLSELEGGLEEQKKEPDRE